MPANNIAIPISFEGMNIFDCSRQRYPVEHWLFGELRQLTKLACLLRSLFAGKMSKCLLLDSLGEAQTGPGFIDGANFVVHPAFSHVCAAASPAIVS